MKLSLPVIAFALIILSWFNKCSARTRDRRVPFQLRFAERAQETRGQQPGKVPLRHFPARARAIIAEKLARYAIPRSVVWVQLVLMPDKNLTRSAVILIRLNPVRRLDESRSVP